MGIPQYISDQDLNLLNKDVNEHIGLAEKIVHSLQILSLPRLKLITNVAIMLII